MMGDLFPDSVAKYAKAWVAFLGFLATTVATEWAEAPSWVKVVGAVLTTVGVYLVRNRQDEV